MISYQSLLLSTIVLNDNSTNRMESLEVISQVDEPVFILEF